MGKGSAKQEVHQYFLSIHYGICHGPVVFKSLKTTDDKVIWQGSISEQTYVDVNMPNLFGGELEEGGLAGRIYFLPGKADQVMPAHIASKWGLTPTTCPGFRGVASLFFTGVPSTPYAANNWVKQAASVIGGQPPVAGGFYWSSNNPIIQGVKVEVESIFTGLSETYARIPLL